MAIDELYLDNLDEFINDENKVVTYKWLSRSIGVHVNQAKQMLHAFVQQQRNKKNNDTLSVMYLLAGTLTGDTTTGVSHKVCIVPEEQLDSTKSRMSQVTSCHVYSVQRCKLKDTHSLYTVDYDILHEHLLTSNRYSAITCTAAKKRSDQELDLLRKRGGEAYAPTYKVKAPPSNGQSKKSQAGALETMFGKAAKKESAKSAESKEQPKPQEKSKESQSKEAKSAPKPAKKAGGIVSMFAKQATKPAAAKPAPEPVKVEEEEEVVDIEAEVEETKKPEPESKKPEPKKPEPKKPEPKQTKAVKSKRDAEKHAAESGKQNKRRRIKQMEVSSSSEDDMDTIPPTPPREPTPEPTPEPSPEPAPVESEEESEKIDVDKPAEKSATIPSKDGRRRKRRRKHVDKTFIDDDGFMVTEKVWESESTDASDIEEPKTKKAPPPKPKEQSKPAEKKVAKKKASPNKVTGKQTSLMNFFKKK